MNSTIGRIKQSGQLQLILGLGFIVQLVFCIVAVGFFHPDQHFQVIEFSSYQLQQPNAASSVWELASTIRPTLQVQLLSLYRVICDGLGIGNPFTQMTLLRVIQGVTFFFVFNKMAFYYCRQQSHRVLIITLLLLNFSWFFPYSRTLFSSEMVAALVFFPMITWFHKRYVISKLTIVQIILTGFVLAMSFYLRFQMAFAIAGFGCWLLFVEKQWRFTLWLIAGFMLGIAVNVWLDYSFYHQLVFTPYLYFKVNLIDGVAASFGEQGFLYYIGVLAALVAAPFISIVLLYHYGKTTWRMFRHPLILSTFLFIVGLFIIGHKEERFSFTIINVIPIVLALDAAAFRFWLPNASGRKWIMPLTWFSIGLNVFLLVMFMLIPYCQTVSFDTALNSRFKGKPITIHCYQRTPLQTESHLPLTFYANGLQQLSWVNIQKIDSIAAAPEKPVWLAATFNDIKDHFSAVDSMGYKPVAYSSVVLWNINQLLLQKKINTINDIWVLYELKVN